MQELLNREARRIERVNNLPEGCVSGVYEQGEIRFYRSGIVMGRVPQWWSSLILQSRGIYTWEAHKNL